jgi:hypothetical protein
MHFIDGTRLPSDTLQIGYGFEDFRLECGERRRSEGSGVGSAGYVCAHQSGNAGRQAYSDALGLARAGGFSYRLAFDRGFEFPVSG